ncbi:MAG: hypothetical protein QME75_09275 [Deltaproteobacteria bacterium]|nr:hypothetical protein [Deltaproteobacteria bacterium]
MKRSAIIIFSAVVLLTAGVTGALYWRWLNSPRYALQQMVLAIQTGNMDKFFKYLDLQEIANNMVDAGCTDLAGPDKPDLDEWDRLSRRLGTKVAKFVLPKLVEKFDKQVKAAIERYLQELSRTEVLALAAAATTAHIDRQGDVAQVKILDPHTGEPFRFSMAWDQSMKEWRVVAIQYQDLKRLLKRELF